MSSTAGTSVTLANNTWPHGVRHRLVQKTPCATALNGPVMRSTAGATLERSARRWTVRPTIHAVRRARPRGARAARPPPGRAARPPGRWRPADAVTTQALPRACSSLRARTEAAHPALVPRWVPYPGAMPLRHRPGHAPARGRQRAPHHPQAGASSAIRTARARTMNAGCAGVPSRAGAQRGEVAPRHAVQATEPDLRIVPAAMDHGARMGERPVKAGMRG